MAGPDAIKIFSGMEKALSRDRHEVIKKAAFRAKTAHLSELNKGTSTLRLRNVGVKGARVGIRYTTKTKGYAMAEGELFATGPVHILDRPTMPHHIIAGTRDGFSALMPTPYGFFAAVTHPGTKGKRTFDKGFKKAQPLISKTIRGRAHETIIANGRL
jgi:hypothetical protein